MCHICRHQASWVRRVGRADKETATRREQLDAISQQGPGRFIWDVLDDVEKSDDVVLSSNLGERLKVVVARGIWIHTLVVRVFDQRRDATAETPVPSANV